MFAASGRHIKSLFLFSFSADLLRFFIRVVVPGCARSATAPDSGRSVNPISTRGTYYAHLSTNGTPGFSDFLTALLYTYDTQRYGVFRCKKNEHASNLSLNFFSFKSFFSFFVQKNGPNIFECYMYKVTNVLLVSWNLL